MRLRRLEAEIVRDSVLAVSGKLDRTIGGTPLPIEVGSDGLTTVPQKPPATALFEKPTSPYSPWRRSLYVFARRNYPVTFLEVMDYPLMAVNCTRRVQSATPLQSLALLNSEFMMEQADFFAARVSAELPTDAPEPKKIETAFLLALGRKPSPAEIHLAEDHLRKQSARYTEVQFSYETASQRALASLCQMLMATNEFLYIE